MIYNIYVVYDSKVGYGAPVLETTEAAAVRNFSLGVKTKGSLMQEYPEDFILFCVGTYDTVNGIIEAHDPISVARALDFKEV